MADPVQTFRAISWLIVKWLLLTIAALIALIGVAVATYFGHHWYTYERHAAKIEPIIRIDDKLCAKGDYPLFISFVNKSGATIDRVSFTLEARMPGRSSNIASFENYSSDAIIKPGEGFGSCYRVPRLSEFVLNLSSLKWSLTLVRYTFAD